MEVFTSIAEKLHMPEKVDLDVDSQLSTMINKLMFRKEKPVEEKLKEKLNLILRPANCTSLVTTKVDELIWQRLRPQTRSFDSWAQVAQACIVKSACNTPDENVGEGIEPKRENPRSTLTINLW